jgi:hypothetical protein
VGDEITCGIFVGFFCHNRNSNKTITTFFREKEMTMLTTALEGSAADYRRDLGEGLVLRWSTAEDSEHIVQQVGYVFREKADEPSNSFLETMVRNWMRGNFPLMGSGDYAIAEDTQRQEGNPIVAGVCLLRQECDYEGIPFGMGRPEVVFTDPAYRRRGIIRGLFEMVHARSTQEGHLIQAITGIPYFYRQFGYEYALDLGGMRGTYLSLIPKREEGEEERVHLEEASVEDIPLLQRLYGQRRTRVKSIVWTHVSDEYWRYGMEGWKQSGSEAKLGSIQLIVDTQGNKIGYVSLPVRRRDTALGVWDLEVEQGNNLQVIMPSLLRALQTYGLQISTKDEKVGPLNEINFSLGRNHPVYTILGQELAPKEQPPYAWYVRVADLPGFLKHITPVLEQRLAGSEMANYSGELKLDFYRGGLKLIFEGGKLNSVENWPVPLYESGVQGGFPPLLFLQVVFGYRTIDELRQSYPDVWVSNEGRVLLSILFPARPSQVLPL